jgi:hypothetical protein
MKNSTNEQCIAQFDIESSKWNKVSLKTSKEVSSSVPFVPTNGNYTFGKIRYDALPLESIIAYAFASNEIVEVEWSSILSVKTIHFKVETSNNAKNFKSIGTVKEHERNEDQLYRFQFIPDKYNDLYIRIAAIDIQDKTHYSKVIHLKNHDQMKHIFPNPATNEIYHIIDKNDEKIDYSIIDATGKRLKPVFERRGNIVVFRIEKLSPRTYTLVIESKDTLKSYPFIKQ